MAIKGLSIPVCGTYSYDAEEETVTYSEPFIADSAIEYGATWTVSENGYLYADNKIKETAKGTFQTGELTLGTADLPNEIAQKIIGATIYKATVSGVGEGTVSELVYDDRQKSPYLGFGIVELHQIDDVDKYRAVFLPKVFFSLPEEAATTKGETVEFQTKSITGTIMRSDLNDANYKHPWLISAWFDTESAALEYLMAKCGKPAA